MKLIHFRNLVRVVELVRIIATIFTAKKIKRADMAFVLTARWTMIKRISTNYNCQLHDNLVQATTSEAYTLTGKSSLVRTERGLVEAAVGGKWLARNY